VADVTCKHCGEHFSSAKSAGTLFCPKCLKAFWIDTPDHAGQKGHAAAALHSGTPYLTITLAVCGFLFFIAATLVYQSKCSSPVDANTISLREAVGTQIQQLESELENETIQLKDLERRLQDQKRRNDRLVFDDQRATANALAPQAPPEEPEPEKPAEAAVDVTKIISECMKSVVVIRGSDGSVGSGFVVSRNGVVVTNRHVVRNLKSVTIEMQRRESKDTLVLRDAQVIAVNNSEDLALVKLPAVPAAVAVKGGYPHLPIRAAATVTGEPVIAIGSPGLMRSRTEIMVLDYTVTRGIISNPQRTIEDKAMIQTSVPVNPGNSGGPLLDEQGNVIGVVTAKSMVAEAVGFALPTRTLLSFLARYKDVLEKPAP